MSSAIGINRNGRIRVICVRHRVGRREQIWMVEGIEQIGPEFQHLIFKLPEVDRKIALNGRVEVNLPRPEE